MIAAGARVSSLDEKRPHCMPMTFDRPPLGNPTEYPERYDPSLLFPIARAGQREAFGLRGPLPFGGVDLWTAYEISWLDAQGKPRIAIGEIQQPVHVHRVPVEINGNDAHCSRRDRRFDLLQVHKVGIVHVHEHWPRSQMYQRFHRRERRVAGNDDLITRSYTLKLVQQINQHRP